MRASAVVKRQLALVVLVAIGLPGGDLLDERFLVEEAAVEALITAQPKG